MVGPIIKVQINFEQKRIGNHNFSFLLLNSSTLPNTVIFRKGVPALSDVYTAPHLPHLFSCLEIEESNHNLTPQSQQYIYNVMAQYID